MPIPVPKFAIEMLTRPGDLVFDPFFGSGTTGAAAEELGRRWVGVDHHQVLLEGASLRPQFENAPGYERSEEHTSELQSLMRISYAVFCLKKKKTTSEPNKAQAPHRTTHTNTP